MRGLVFALTLVAVWASGFWWGGSLEKERCSGEVVKATRILEIRATLAEGHYRRLQEELDNASKGVEEGSEIVRPEEEPLEPLVEKLREAELPTTTVRPKRVRVERSSGGGRTRDRAKVNSAANRGSSTMRGWSWW